MLHFDAAGDHVVLMVAQRWLIEVQVMADAMITGDVLLGLLLAVLVTLALDLRRCDGQADFSGRLQHGRDRVALGALPGKKAIVIGY